jgi:prephenate dehydratase
VAEGITKIEYYAVDMPNKPGTGAHVLNAFKEAGINFTAMWGYPVGQGNSRIDLVPENPAEFKKVAKKLKIALGPKQVAFHVVAKDKKGAVGAITQKLADAGVNMRAVLAVCSGAGRFGGLIEVDAADLKKATKLLK